MIANISSIMIFVNNQQESLNFWVEKLGFKIIKDTVLDSKIRWIQLAPPESTVPTLILFPKSLITIRESRPLPIIIFRTQDIERTLEHMRNKDIVVSHHPMNSAVGSYTTFQDNEGNEFIILEDDKNNIVLEFEV